MTVLMALLLTIGVGAVAVIHVVWGLGSHWPEASEEALARSVVGDGRSRMPPPWQCFLVALVLGVMALWPWYVLGRIDRPAVLAGTYRMSFRRFMIFNVLGAAIWAGAVGYFAYGFGELFHRMEGMFAWAALGVGLVALVVAGLYLRRTEVALQARADEALLGSGQA